MKKEYLYFGAGLLVWVWLRGTQAQAASNDMVPNTSQPYFWLTDQWQQLHGLNQSMYSPYQTPFPQASLADQLSVKSGA